VKPWVLNVPKPIPSSVPFPSKPPVRLGPLGSVGEEVREERKVGGGGLGTTLSRGKTPG